MRYHSIDVLRTVAVFIMVLVHFGENLSGVISPMAGFGAPLFAFLSGVSYRLWVAGLEAKDVSDADIAKATLRRGVFVIAVGFLFNVVVWLPRDLFNWDVLTFIGAALLTLGAARKIPLPALATAAIAAVLVSPVLRHLADYEVYWVNRYFEHDWVPSDVIIGFLATGYFPFFPWIAYSLAGFIVGGVIYEDASKTHPDAAFPRAVFCVGVVLLFFSMAALVVHALTPLPGERGMLGGWTMFPPTVEYVTGTLGLTIMSTASLYYFIDCRGILLRDGWILNVARTFSRNAFTLYIAHHVVHLWPLWLYAVVEGHEPMVYWMKAISASVAIPLALAFLFCSYLILRRLERIGDVRGIEYWMRRLCDVPPKSVLDRLSA